MKKSTRKSKHNYPVLMIVLLCIITVAASLILPELLLNNKSQRAVGQVNIAPESYYVESGNALARNTSSKLTSLEQIKLISGSWESTKTLCTNDQGFLTENEAVELARSSLNAFYDVGVFPYSSDSNYNNWCSWDATLYCYTDNLFDTYSAYLWVITFTKFDGTISHTVYMTEKGVILGAETSDTEYQPNKLISAYTAYSIHDILADENITLLEKKTAPENTVIKPVYPETNFSDVDFDQIYVLDLVSDQGELESYYIYQYSGENVYGIGICPVN